MKTKNMRKKALVSSLAMLLVAVIALSGATFAWWSSNATVSVSSASLTSSKDSSLLMAISDTEPAASAYKATHEVNWTQTVTPMSSVGNGTFYKVAASETEKADGDLQKIAANGITPVSASSTDGYIKQTLWFLADSAINVKLTKAEINASTGSKTRDLDRAVRISLVPYSSNNTVAGTPVVYCLGSANDSYSAITGTSGDYGTPTFGALYGGEVLGVNFDSVTAIPAANSAAFLSIPDNSGAVRVDMYIWLEGNDSACSNAIAGGSISGLEFEFGS